LIDLPCLLTFLGDSSFPLTKSKSIVSAKTRSTFITHYSLVFVYIKVADTFDKKCSAVFLAGFMPFNFSVMLCSLMIIRGVASIGIDLNFKVTTPQHVTTVAPTLFFPSSSDVGMDDCSVIVTIIHDAFTVWVKESSFIILFVSAFIEFGLPVTMKYPFSSGRVFDVSDHLLLGLSKIPAVNLLGVFILLEGFGRIVFKLCCDHFEMLNLFGDIRYEL